MSHVSVRGEQSTSSEITALTNLAALATSGAGQAIAKTGATTFANVTAGAPAGSNTQIQFNDSGSFGGDADLTWDKTGNVLSIAGDMYFSDDAAATNRYLQVRDQSTLNTRGNTLILVGGKGNGNGIGGSFQLTAGTGGDSGNDGGEIDFTGGSGGLGGGNGGAIVIRGGSGVLGGEGGLINIHTGDSDSADSGDLQLDVGIAGPTSNGGFAQVHAGDGGSTSGNGGVAELQGGNVTNGVAGYAALLAGEATTGDGGDIIIQTGSGSVTNGKFKFAPKSHSTVYGILDFDSLASSDKTFTFPNASGTLPVFDANYRIFGDSGSPYLRLSDSVGTQLGYGDTSVILGGTSLGIVINGSNKASFATSSLTADKTFTFPNQTGTFMVQVAAPASASASGVAGTFAYDSSYFYICTASNTWRRIAHATW